MGEVFRALDTATGHLVALKVLRDDSDRDRFEREARALTELDHPAIVRPVAYGSTPAGEPYLAMEWLEGEDLAALLRRRRLSIDEVLGLARRVAGALSQAHTRGMIHRDIKPANLFLEHGDVGQAKLLDFGIARFEGQARVTRTGALLGTPGYMAPEQARGDEKLTPALDVFSLGCVLFEALAGRPTFEGQHMMAVLAKVLFMEAPLLEAHCPEAPAALAVLISRMLAKDPEARPRDGMALHTELAALAAHSESSGPAPQPATPPGALTQDEQRMVSVVMIGQGLGGAWRVESDTTLPAQVRSLAEQAAGRLEYLADGSIAIAFGGLGVIKDQVTLAARCALALRLSMRGVPIALATGRSTTRKASTLGEAIERAVQRIKQQDEAQAPEPLPVAIDETTAALLDSRFDWREGAAGPELWSEREQTATARTLLGKPTPCVGREIELRMLEQAFDTCVEEPSAQVFLITASAGTGKSRLAHEFAKSIRRRSPEAVLWLGRADSTSEGSSLHLLGHALRGALGLQSSEPLEVLHQKLRTRFAGHGTPADAQRLYEFLGELVGAPFPEPGSAQLTAARQDAQLMAEQLQRAFEDFLRTESAAHPVVLVLDDLHWGDAASVRFVDVALRGVMNRPVLVLGLARPEVHARFPQLWAGRDVQALYLRALSRRASERLAQAVLGEQFIGKPLEQIISQADGNAFYLEELIRAAAEGKSTLPDTVVAMVQSRLAGLEPDARRVLRAASIFGELFWRGAAVALLGGMRPAQAQDWLLLLVQREVLVRHQESRFPGEGEFAFRHALLREGAYALLTEEDRSLGHRLAGEWLEQHGRGDALALAEHFERGGELERAVHHYGAAAEHASAADDGEAVLACVERGLRCNPQGEPRGILLSLKASVHLGREQYAETAGLASEALALLRQGSRRWCMTIHDIFPALALSQPELLMPYALRFLEVSLLPEARSDYLRSATWLVVTLELTGVKDAAASLMARIRAESAHLDDHDASAWAHLRSCEANHYHLGEEAPWSCLRSNAESVRRFEQAEIWRYRCLVGSFHGKAHTDLGDRVGGEAILRENLEVAERRGGALPLMYARLYLARHLVRLGPAEQLDEAQRLARTAITGSNTSLMGVAHSVLAEVALRCGELETAEAEVRQACELAQPFPAYSWEIVALRVRILLLLGRVEEARSLSEDRLQDLERLRLAGHGEIELRLSVAEARAAAGDAEATREMLRLTLARLRLRVDDIPEATARARYLTEVATQARLLALARQWLGAEAVRAAGLEPGGS